MADKALRSPAASVPETARAARARRLRGLSLSGVQAIVGTVAGIATIVGAGFSLMQAARPASTGELVAIVQDAGSRLNVAGATVEVLTPERAIVATLTPDSTGRATQELREGVYIVRVSHPRYSAETRRVRVLPRQTTEMRAALRAGSSSPFGRAVDGGVSAVRKALRF
jgi:hypothetical protein